ncbi:MAG: DNA primase [Tissierellia bacterium]|nr:DNA primase [Tissierellia bacterium]
MTIYVDDELIEKVKDYSDIVDIVSDYVQLRRSGANYVGLCPFHNEKSPSFTVSESKQLYHCFGCGEGGDVISFLMKIENLDFIEAVKFLAGKYNIEVQSKRADDRYLKEKERLYLINREAARFFFRNLTNNKRPLEYLYNRQIDSKTIRRFGLGYALNSWDSLHTYLLNKGFKSEEIEKIGLIGRKSGNNGYYDKFRDRIIFPIIDLKSRVIGFGGRVLDDSMPKYLNSSDSLIFNKGNFLYGLNLVNKYSDRKKILLVEGYMDVISLFAAGVNYAVASLGTALTERQAKLLKRFGEEVYICFDSDPAGIKATLRAIDILLKADVKPRIIQLPAGMDPDEYIKKKGIIEFEKLFKKSINHIDYKINLAKSKYDLESIEDKVEFTQEVARILKSLDSPIEQDAYIKKISEDTGISLEAIQAEVRGKGSRNFKSQQRKPKISPVDTKVVSASMKAELDLIILMMEDRDYFDLIEESLDNIDYFTNEDFKSLYQIIKASYNGKTSLDREGVLDLYAKENPDPKILETVRNHQINYQLTRIEEIIGDLINTLKYNKLEKERNKILKQIEVLENKVNRSKEEEVALLNYCLELTRLNKEIKLIRHE